MQVLYKRKGKKEFIVAGHFNAKEIKEWKSKGYRIEKKENRNKHGIPVR